MFALLLSIIFLVPSLTGAQDLPVVLQNSTPIAISLTQVGYLNYSFAVTADMLPISVNILLEAQGGSALGQIFVSVNSSSSCTYTQYPTSVQYCQYSGWASPYNLVSINEAQVDTIAISAYLQTINSPFNLKVLAYPLMQLYNGSQIDINSMDSVHSYSFNRYYSFINDPTISEALYIILEGKSALDYASLYVSVNCSNRVYNPFPSSISNYKGTLYSDKSMFLQINFNLGTPCLVSIGTAITAYNSGFKLKVLSYPFTALSNNTVFTIDSLNSTNNYAGFYRYYSYIAKNSESPGAIYLIVNGVSTTDQARVYATTDCSNSCQFNFFPDTLNNCFYTPYSNPAQILTVTYSTVCFISIAVLVDVFSQGLTVQAVVYPVISLRNNTYSTIYSISSQSQPFYRFFSFVANIVGSVDILLEGLTGKDIGGIYADTDCEGGCAFSNFPSISSTCYQKYQSQNTFVAINLASTCNISIGIYVNQLSASLQTKVVLYPTFTLPNGLPVLIDSFGSSVGYQNMDRYYNFIIKDTDTMGNLTIVLEGISSSDPSQLYVTTNCQNNCSYNPYPSSNSYCYETTYNTIGQIQIYLQTACTVTINTHLVNYNLGSRLTATYYNVCPNHIDRCVTCNQSMYYNSSTQETNLTYFCYGCVNYYAANPTTHLSCQFCNQTVGYFVDTSNQGFCTKCQPNCFNCTNGNTCLQCDQGYLFNQISLTQSNCLCSVANCTNCSSGGICTTCSPGFGLYSVSNLCVPCLIANCQSCSFDANFAPTCNYCLNGMMFSNGSCMACSQLVANCSVCLNAKTCQQCSQGSYLSNGVCNPCGDSNTLGCTTCSSDFSCSSCLSGYYLNTDDTCKLCTSLYPHCLKCSLQDCLQCAPGYWYNGTTSMCNPCKVSNCSECDDPNVCDTCMSGYTIYNNTCLSCNNNTSLSDCSSCDLGSSSKNVCLSCNPSFYYSNSSQTCQSCFMISSTCMSCLNSSYCTQCLNTSVAQTYLYQDPTLEGVMTCVTSCPSGTGLNTTSFACQSCSSLFGNGCVNCQATGCTTCGLIEPYFYGNSCSPCNLTTQTVVDNIYCFDSPNLTTVNLTNIGVFVNLVVNCSIASQVFFIYGLLESVDGYNFSSVKNLTSIIPPTDFISTWIGEGEISTDSTGFLNLTLNGPFKNSGDMYRMKLWCQYSNKWGSLTTNGTVLSWTQFNNGARIVVIQVNTSSYVNYNKQPIVAQAIQRALGIQREIYTQDFIPASSFKSSRLLLQQRIWNNNDDEKLSEGGIHEKGENNGLKENAESRNRNLQSFVYTNTYYIAPDYRISYDYMESVVNSSLQNSTLFAQNIQNYITIIDSTTVFGVLNVAFVGSVNNTANPQAFFSNYPAFSVQNTTILVKYILETSGYLYFGIRVGDSTTTVNNGVINATLSWNNFKAGLDFNGNSFLKYTVIPSQSNILLTVNYSSLDANTTYFLFVGAGNNGFPQNLTNIVMVSMKTGWIWGNNTVTNGHTRLEFTILTVLITIVAIVFL